MKNIFSEIKNFTKSALTRQKTVVTTRDGKIFEESITNNGIITNYIGKGPTPSYLDEPNNSNKLVARLFNPQTHSWEFSETPIDQFGTQMKIMKFVSYNVWFSEKNWFRRAHALFQLISNKDPDFVCLQEVTPKFLTLLLQQSWIREKYFVSDGNGCATVMPYGVVILSKLPFVSLSIYTMPSNMGRRFLLGSVQVHNEIIYVGTVHLESMQNAPIRILQLECIHSIIKDLKHVFVMGDFNFTSYNKENNYIALFGYVDAWKEKYYSSEMPIDYKQKEQEIDHQDVICDDTLDSDRYKHSICNDISGMNLDYNNSMMTRRGLKIE